MCRFADSGPATVVFFFRPLEVKGFEDEAFDLASPPRHIISRGFETMQISAFLVAISRSEAGYRC
eukprot:597407-Hanusia_phi.AAC.1